ncbi:MULTISPECIES: PEP-CTERM sorting domain-containing protein [Aquabacterium]|jgi:hypothetical protein|uniref:PEP-CTERM sorting domain-containing protein n=1 Tax=Aquabacterium TaxID=92793 RepID=UPI0009FAEFC8|nr:MULTISPECIES: PEP-CTERM sorting domain-containing protein [Aquabacterium]MBU0917590.1 PEP-CTERM sorting domain-containing protein [Gammaproteobacteria bacterium]
MSMPVCPALVRRPAFDPKRLPGATVLAACLALALPMAAQAAPVQWATGQVLIDFDPDTFVFQSDTTYNGLMDISPDAMGYAQSGQGVVINLGGLVAAYASSYPYFSEDSRSASFSALFNFTAEAGYVINGYTIKYTGGYFTESPGNVGLNAQSGAITTGGNFGGDSFSIETYQAGAAAPQLSGNLSAWGGVDYIEVLDRYEQVYSHDEQVLDYCETEEPFTCYYTYVPVYIEQPVYRYETDLGEAQIFLSSIEIHPTVVAVPEPGTTAMTLAGLMGLGWWAARRRRTA